MPDFDVLACEEYEVRLFESRGGFDGVTRRGQQESYTVDCGDPGFPAFPHGGCTTMQGDYVGCSTAIGYGWHWTCAMYRHMSRCMSLTEQLLLRVKLVADVDSTLAKRAMKEP